MNRETAIKALRQHAPELRALGVTRLALFGSTARGDAREDSDLDALIGVGGTRQFPLLDLSGVRLFVNHLFGVETDVVIANNLRPRMRAKIAPDIVEVF